jgi:hypothetical protein
MRTKASREGNLRLCVSFAAMKEFIPAEVTQEVTDAIQLTLRGDKPENKLLGIQFAGV